MALELAELKLTVASNLIKLRTDAGMTQVELGTKLNYSDKTISKWERGEAIPDAYVLTQLGKTSQKDIDSLLPWSESLPEELRSSKYEVPKSVVDSVKKDKYE